MSDDQKRTDPLDPGTSDPIEDKSDETPQGFSESRDRLLLEQDFLLKGERGGDLKGTDAHEPFQGEGDDSPGDLESHRGVLARLFRRPSKRSATSKDDRPEMSDIASSEVEGGDLFKGTSVQEPEPDSPSLMSPADVAEAPAEETSEKSMKKGLFARKREIAEPVADLMEAVPSEASGDDVKVSPGLDHRAKKIKSSSKKGFPPIQVLIGWVDESSRKDVLEHARGFAEDHIETLETAWITMAEFRGGTIFEIHEGGSGQAYLPDLIEELSRDPEQVLWVPSGTKLNRVVTLSLVDGRPFSMMLNEKDSALVRGSGQEPIGRSGRMRRLSPRGTQVLVVGATLFMIGFSGLITSTFLAASVQQQPLPTLSYNPDTLPHGQIITLSNALRDDRWVSRIVFENGTWRADFETFDELTLPEDTAEAQRLIDEAVERDAVLQRERDRKIEELISE